MTVFINLTPHDINLTVSGTQRTIRATGCIARAKETHEVTEHIDGIPILSCHYGKVQVIGIKSGEIKDMPKETQGAYYIVSNIAAHMFPPERNDILVPGDPIRDDKGKIIGCQGLCRL